MIGSIAVAARAEVPDLPSRLKCTYAAAGRNAPYEVVIAFDQKTGKLYTSRGGKIASATITDGEITILHTVTPPDGEREVTTTTINRGTGEIVLKREGGGILETGKCVKVRD